MTTLRSLVRTALAALGRPRSTASVVLTGDDAIRRLNRDFREVDRATDVLSFPLADPSEVEDPAAPVYLGEVYVSIDTAFRQARAARRPYPREIAHLVVHGLLHLLGHDHPTRAQRRRMAAVESRLMGALRREIAALGTGRPAGRSGKMTRC